MLRTPSSHRKWFLLFTLSAFALGLYGAISRAWLCDDAYISFRYARHLTEGHGLVFNVGERVEGFTNLSWTLWCALGLWCGFSAETWSLFWGVVCFGVSLILLLVHHFQVRRRRDGAWWLPAGLVLAAGHTQWQVYATSGLETSTFTMLAIAGYICLTAVDRPGIRLALAAGVLWALASLTRPDGVIFVALGGLFLLWKSQSRIQVLLTYSFGFAVLYLPITCWRVGYYGDFFPNTYYAKSAYLSWWDQGLKYLRLYLEQYWMLGLGWLMGVFCFLWWGLKKNRLKSGMGSMFLSVALAIGYAGYVCKVGGDFMHARMLIPATPFLLIGIEYGLAAMAWKGKWSSVLLVLILFLAEWESDVPIQSAEFRYGIADEWWFYHQPYLVEQYQQAAPILKKYLSDLPVRVAFMGSEARLMYEGQVSVAIEAETGLTDAVIAKQELRERYRVGHEKKAPVSYLILDRRCHLIFQSYAIEALDLERWIPLWGIEMDGLQGLILHWDPVILEELKKRGAVFLDFPARLDEILSQLPKFTDDQVSQLYQQAKMFYFDHVEDARREQIFLRRLPPAHSTSQPD